MQSSVGIGLQYFPSNPLKYFLLYIAVSPVKTPIFKFSTRNPSCGLPSPRARLSGKIENSPIKNKIFKILPSNSNSPIESRICEFSRRTQFPRSATYPRNSPCECEKRFVKEQTYIKRPYPLLLHPFTAFGA